MWRFGYRQSHATPMFIKGGDGKITVLIVYVDDIVINNDVEEVSCLKSSTS